MYVITEGDWRRSLLLHYVIFLLLVGSTPAPAPAPQPFTAVALVLFRPPRLTFLSPVLFVRIAPLINNDNAPQQRAPNHHNKRRLV